MISLLFSPHSGPAAVVPILTESGALSRTVLRVGLALSLSLVLAGSAQGQSADSDRSRDNDVSSPTDPPTDPREDRRTDPAAIAPFGVTGSRTLPKGDWSFSYRYTIHHLDDLRDGTGHKPVWEVLGQFEQTPTKRDIHEHLFGVSFAPHRRVTLLLELPLLEIETDSVGPSRRTYRETTQGLGDLSLRALVPFMRNGDQTLQVEFGLTAPTGSISKRGPDDSGNRDRLPFGQQLGSGTVDLLPGLLYRGHHDSLSWGLLARGVLSIYENNKDYRKGSQYQLSTWMSQSFTDWMSGSVRLSWERWGNMHPAEPTTKNPELDPKRYQGEAIELGPGVNFRLPFAGSTRVGVEMAWPIFQTMEGPQLERDWTLTAGIQVDF